jgi:murein L,D-transpeptidase YcbB/YkuD
MQVRTGLLVGASVAMLGSVAAWRSRSDAAREQGECDASAVATPVAQDTTDELRLVLNLPAYTLDVLEHGERTRSIPVAVGQRKYPSPVGHFRVDYATWNPWWHPPDRAWARHEKVTPPGWANPVGRVKLHVTDLVFMHGTPLEDSRGSAASHACIRMSNADAIALARLVHAYAGPPVSPALLDSLVADTSRTRTLVLSRTVPVDFDYDLAAVRDGALWVYVDIYRFAGTRVPAVREQALQALAQVAADTALIDSARVRALVRSATRTSVHLAVESLFVRTLPARLPPGEAVGP